MIVASLMHAHVLPYVPRPGARTSHHLDVVPWIWAGVVAWVLWNLYSGVRNYGPAAQLMWAAFTRLSTLVTLSLTGVAAGVLLHKAIVIVIAGIACAAAVSLRNVAGRKFAEYDTAAREQDAGTNPLAGSGAATRAYAHRVKRRYRQ